MFLTFIPEELEELRRFDAEIDAAPMEYEDFLISDFVEALLFPERERERAKRREHSRRTYERDKEKRKQYSREYRAAHKEEAAARKRAYDREYQRRRRGLDGPRCSFGRDTMLSLRRRSDAA